VGAVANDLLDDQEASSILRAVRRSRPIPQAVDLVSRKVLRQRGLRVVALGIVAAALTLTAVPPPAEGRSVDLGISMKYFGSRPAEDTALRAVAPSIDSFLTSLRWNSVQHSCADIRRGRYDWRRLDRAMTKVAGMGLSLTGVLKHGPACASAGGFRTQPKPRYMREWRLFARKLVARYGPDGSYPSHPLRRLEVWSEPNLSDWTSGPRGYARAFVKVAAAVRSTDRSVKLIVGGPGFGNDPGKFLRQLYAVRGFRGTADLVGAHTYSPTPNVAIRALKRFRRIMRQSGDRAPIVITEHGWSTCPRPERRGKCVRPRRQARYMGRLVRRLRGAQRLRVAGFYWFGVQDFATPESARECRASPKDFYGFYTHGGKGKPSRRVWQRLTSTRLASRIPENPRTRRCRGKYG
jgi:hypothetical protein